jgi:Na+-translocating ferredoxin:NAD+ oxidoreductase RnfC subunit
LQAEDTLRAERAKRRFELHQQRMEHLNAEEEARRQKRAQLAENRRQVSSESIQAALDRVRAKKQD